MLSEKHNRDCKQSRKATMKDARSHNTYRFRSFVVSFLLTSLQFFRRNNHQVFVCDMNREVNGYPKSESQVDGKDIVHRQSPEVTRACHENYDQENKKYDNKSHFHVKRDKENHCCHNKKGKGQHR